MRKSIRIFIIGIIYTFTVFVDIEISAVLLYGKRIVYLAVINRIFFNKNNIIGIRSLEFIKNEISNLFVAVE